jgi:23S rRNA (cytosine1962-C5)-methyltransferase
VAVIFDRKNRFLAVGLLDPTSPIRVRVLQVGEPAQIGGELFRERLEAALSLRRALADDPATTGYRLVHGEGDRLPGLVLDRYGDAAVFKVYSPAWLPWLDTWVEVLREVVSPRLLIGLVSRRVAGDEGCPASLRRGTALVGEIDGPLPFVESGLRFEAHPLEGHKTGFYLDQRDNRRRVEGLSDDAELLSVFSHTGGFSIYAGRGGARGVTCVDTSGPALAQARRHAELNADVMAGVRHRMVEGDAFQVLAELRRDRRRFQAVVVDPPSFAKEAGQREGALDSYRALCRLALGVLDPDGLLVQASCSSRVEPEEFFAALHAGARDAGRELRELTRTGQPVDHPVGPLPEGRYLKCLFARAT